MMYDRYSMAFFFYNPQVILNLRHKIFKIKIILKHCKSGHIVTLQNSIYIYIYGGYVLSHDYLQVIFILSTFSIQIYSFDNYSCKNNLNTINLLSE